MMRAPFCAWVKESSAGSCLQSGRRGPNSRRPVLVSSVPSGRFTETDWSPPRSGMTSRRVSEAESGAWAVFRNEGGGERPGGGRSERERRGDVTRAGRVFVGEHEHVGGWLAAYAVEGKGILGVAGEVGLGLEVADDLREAQQVGGRVVGEADVDGVAEREEDEDREAEQPGEEVAPGVGFGAQVGNAEQARDDHRAHADQRFAAQVEARAQEKRGDDEGGDDDVIKGAKGGGGHCEAKAGWGVRMAD